MVYRQGIILFQQLRKKVNFFYQALNLCLLSSNLLGIRFVWLLFLATICSCVSQKNIPEGAFILHSQEIKGNETISSESLETLYRQKPNRKIFGGLPYVWAYNYGKKIFKPEKVEQKITQKEERFNKKIIHAENELSEKRNASLSAKEAKDLEALQRHLDKAEKKEDSLAIEEIKQDIQATKSFYNKKKRQKSPKVLRLERRKKKKLDKLQVRLKEGNWLMRTVGEKPVYFDTLETRRTAEEIQEYLESKGFFQSKVSIQTKKVYTHRKKVIYQVEENEPTYFGEINLLANDPDIERLWQQSLSECSIVPGKPYDVRKISSERLRVQKLLRNNGYLFFSSQYIIFRVDTLHLSDTLALAQADTLISISGPTNEAKNLSPQRRARVQIVINEPQEGKHQAYPVDRVFFHLVNTRRRKGDPDTLHSARSNIEYVHEGPMKYNPGILNRRIRFRPGQLYSQADLVDTQRSLGILNMFKFVNINPDTSSIEDELLMHIYTTPLERYQLSNEVGFNVVQGLPGPFINLSLKNRNTFGGAEIFETSIRFALDGQASFSDDNYSSIEAGLNTSLTFPKIVFPLRRNWREGLNFVNPTTQLNLGFNFVRRPEYTRTNLASSISYQGQFGFSRLNFTLAELNIVNTRNISQSFNEILQDLSNSGNPIIESFDRALVSSIYAIYSYNTNTGNERNPSFFVRFLVEGGGLTQSLWKNIPLLNAEDERVFGLKLFRYWRINPTVFYYYPLKKKFHSLAFRFNTGIARPFGGSSTLPYEKFFFGGGSSSIRAWQSRRLGPGSSRPDINDDGTFDNRFERPGEIIIEANAEYRFPLFGFVRGAVFLDAGNVWTFEEDPDRPGSNFRFSNFYSQIALGSGFGVRFNFPFLLLRLDFGVKVYDPARRSDRRWVIQEFKPLRPFRNDLTLLNIAIGYPF